MPPKNPANPTPTIFAMGGGGFTMEPENPALDEYILSLAEIDEPKICLLPTAGGDSEHQISGFYATFTDRPCAPSHISLFRLGQNPVPLREHLLAQDIIYVGGGSMVNLLAIWRGHGLDAILRDAWHAGVVLAGLSAGSMCWFEWGITKGRGAPTPTPGLGFLAGSNSVHYNGERERRPVYLAAVRDGLLPGGYAADDGVGLLFRGTGFAEAVSSRPDARAYRVTKTADGVHETPIEPRLLESARATSQETSGYAIAELRRTLAARDRLERSGRRYL